MGVIVRKHWGFLPNILKNKQQKNDSDSQNKIASVGFRRTHCYPNTQSRQEFYKTFKA